MKLDRDWFAGFDACFEMVLEVLDNTLSACLRYEEQKEFIYEELVREAVKIKKELRGKDEA